MTGETITYSNYGNGGWTSFWSYVPEWILGMNSSLYTWNKGSLYKHATNARRNNFYGKNYPSTITTLINQDPLSNKMFKTLSLDSTAPWDADITTDMSNGFIDESYYKEKEGMWYAYIRRDDNTIDTRALSTQGIGTMLSYTSPTMLFSFNIGTSISVGDKVYRITAGSLVLLGTVNTHAANSITLVTPVVNTPVAGDMIVYVKNSQAESFGARGYYMEAKLTYPYIESIPDNVTIGEVEIFSVSSSTFISNM